MVGMTVIVDIVYISFVQRFMVKTLHKSLATVIHCSGSSQLWNVTNDFVGLQFTM